MLAVCNPNPQPVVKLVDDGCPSHRRDGGTGYSLQQADWSAAKPAGSLGNRRLWSCLQLS